MARRKRYQLPRKKSSTFTLNITSMTDMFTIMLVFLLQSYTISEVEMKPIEGLKPPSSASMVNPTLSLQLSLSKNTLKIDQLKVADLVNSDFQQTDLETQDANFIKPLYAELEKISKEAGENKQYIKDGKILLQADRDLPYGTLRKVMYTASMAGFPQLKLVTMVGE